MRCSSVGHIVPRNIGQVQMLHDASKIAAKFIQAADIRGPFHCDFKRLQRITAVRASMGDILGHRRSAG